MKRKIISLIAILALCVGFANAQVDLRKNLSQRKSITVVFLSKSLLQMMPNVGIDKANLGSISKKIEQLEIYTADNDKDAKFMLLQIDSIAKNPIYEVLMSVREGDEEVTFYAMQDPRTINLKNFDENTFKELIMVVSEAYECTIIRMLGQFTTADIQGVAQHAK